jgi:hypothetical protein
MHHKVCFIFIQIKIFDSQIIILDVTLIILVHELIKIMVNGYCFSENEFLRSIFIYLLIHPPSSIYSLIYSFIHLSIYSYIHSSIYPSIHLSISFTSHPFILHPFIFLFLLSPLHTTS